MRSAKNILIIQLGDIGDVVVTTPCFRAVKETIPDARLSVLVRRPYGSLLEADPHLDEIVEAAKAGGKIAEIGGGNYRLVRQLRRAKHDCVIDLRTGDRGAILALLTGAPVRVSRYGDDKSFWRNRIFNRLVYGTKPPSLPTHPGAEQSLSLLRTIGIETEDSTPKLWVSNAAIDRARSLLARENVEGNGRWVTINPFSRWKYKEWGREKWVETIDWLHETHALRSVLVGSRDEAEDAAAIVRKCRGGGCSLAGKTTLAELAAVLSLGKMHLGVDSAAPHIAAAVGTPSVTVFGPSDWRAWMVPDATHRVVTPDMECVPCSRKGCDHREKSVCLDEMGTDRMKGAVEEVLEALRGQGENGRRKSS